MAKQVHAGLSLWDRLVLLVAWAVTCGLVYVLGFYVGKGMQDRRLGLEERIVRLPVTGPPPPAGQRPAADSDLTFYDALVSGQKAAENRAEAPVTRPPPSPISELRAAPPATAPAAPAAGARPEPPRTAARPAGPAPGMTSTPVPPAEPPKVAARPVPPATAPVGPPRGGWTVVADLMRNREEAEALERQLRSHGYDAAVVRVARDGEAWYRVRVGRFSTSTQAEDVRQRLREREGVAHVFVASE